MIRFDAVDGGLAVTDVVEETHYRIESGAVTPHEAPTDALPTPVDNAARVTVTDLRLPTVVDCFLRDATGTLRHAVDARETRIEEATVLETTTAPMKLYLRFEGPATLVTDDRETRLRFEQPRDVLIGARSAHRQPADTVTVPESPAGLARGISLFGSSLKTTSPERSFPTLRGHPPLVEYGTEFDAAGLDPPDTDITIEVPSDYASVFTVTPLAYYLGAQVATGADQPRLVVDGKTVPLSGDLRTATADLLRHCFLLDCITRTEGLYPVALHERDQAAERVPIDPERWYGLSLAERTAEYLDVPMEPVADLLDWHLTADIEPVPRNAEILPFVANDLALVRSPTPTARTTATVSEPAELTDFFRTRDERRPDGGHLSRRRATQNADSLGDEVVSPVDCDTYGHIWVGQHFPMGSAKPTVDAYQRRLQKQPGDGTSTSVTLVCNDTAMLDEADEGLYGFFDMLTFDVESHYDLTTDELREVLSRETNFLHYVGHVDERGLQCADGYLDLETLERTGIDAFLLNGCTSYEQGQALVDAGAYGGVVTLTSVSNNKATKTGRNLAHLLDIGFDFFGALDVIRRTRISRQNYVVVGDGRITISQSDSGVLYVYDVESIGPDETVLRCLSYVTRIYDIGTMGRTYLSNSRKRYVVCGEFSKYRVPTQRFIDEVQKERTAMLLDGSIHWTNTYEF